MERAPDRSADPHHDRRWLILAVIGIAQLMVVLDATIVNIALPSAQQDLGFSDDDRQWVITAYALAFGSLLLLGGRIGDLFGRKWTFIVGLLGFAGASALGGAAQSFGVLVAARALQGVFAALLAPAALSLLTTTFTEPGRARQGVRRLRRDRRQRAARSACCSAACSPRSSTGAGACTCRSSSPSRPRSPRPACCTTCRSGHRPRLDIPGALTASSGLFALVFGFSHAETRRLGRPGHGRLPGRGRRAARRVRRARSAGSRTRCCRCASSPTATAAARSSRSRSPAPACSACSCS